MRKKYKKNRFWIAVFCLFICLFAYSGYRIIRTINDSRETNKIISDLKNNNAIDFDFIFEEETKEEETANSTVESKKESLELNFQKLKNINSDTVAWIRMEGTSIDYPVVQGNDNTYYLNHSFYKENNINGWVYMNYKNNKDFSDSNTVIYGHNTNSSTMFSDLKKIYDRQLNSDSIIIFLEDKVLKYQIFAVYLVDPDDSLSISPYVSSVSLEEFKKRSSIDYSVDVTENDSILTLSTCHNVTDRRVIIHAKLI